MEHVLLASPVSETTTTDLGGRGDEEPESSSAASRLRALKARVPDAVAAVGRHRWEALVDGPPPPPLPAHRPSHTVASRAYHKLHEILLSCALPPPTRSVHLCEAPGGFVQATGDWAMQGKGGGWTWRALSLPATAATRRLPAPAIPATDRGHFVLGDVLCEAEHAELACRMGTADLVTADGAVEMDHSALEAAHLPLLLAQSRLALRCLDSDGCLVIKFFEGLTLPTQLWIAWLGQHFRGLGIIKPTTSRSTNSERYLIARGFSPPLRPVEYERMRVPDAWLARTSVTLHRLADEQSRALGWALDAASRRAERPQRQ